MINKSNIQVSVCMATFNGARFIREQIDSILIQLSEYDELIISDDSSSDNTIEIIKSYADSRIVFLENNLFRNPITNFENAIKNARGEVIFLADQDDIWSSQKITMMRPLIKRHGLVLSNCSLINEDRIVLQESFFDLINSKQGLLRNLLGVNSYIGCCIGFSREVLNHALPFPPNIPMHDIWIGVIAEWYCRPVFLEDCLVLHRIHSGNASSTGLRSKNSLATKLFIRIQTTRLLLTRVFVSYFRLIRK